MWEVYMLYAYVRLWYFNINDRVFICTTLVTLLWSENKSQNILRLNVIYLVDIIWKESRESDRGDRYSRVPEAVAGKGIPSWYCKMCWSISHSFTGSCFWHSRVKWNATYAWKKVSALREEKKNYLYFFFVSLKNHSGNAWKMLVRGSKIRQIAGTPASRKRWIVLWAWAN